MWKRFNRLLECWQVWSRASTNRSIFSAAVIVAILTLLARFVTVAKDIFIASTFGIGDELDMFLMAYIVPSFAISVFAGSFYSAFVPVFIRVKETRGHAEAVRFFSNVSHLAFIALSFVTVVFALTDKWLFRFLASGFDAHKLQKTVALFEQMLPLLLIGGMALFGGAVLNAQKRFALSAFAPVFTPGALILVLFLSSGVFSSQQLVKGTLIGSVLELCFIVWGLSRAGYLHVLTRPRLDENCRLVIGQYFPMIGGAFLMSGTIVIDQVMVAWLAPGSVSVLIYANKVPALVTGLSAAALGTVVLPFLSQQIAGRDFRNLKHTMRTYSRLILFLSVPASLVLILFSSQLVEVLFQRGAFGSADTLLVSDVLRFSLLQIPFYILGTLYARYISALKGNRFLLYAAMINLIVNVVLNYVLMHYMGVAGVAMSTAIVNMVSVGFMYYASVKKLSVI